MTGVVSKELGFYRGIENSPVRQLRAEAASCLVTSYSMYLLSDSVLFPGFFCTTKFFFIEQCAISSLGV